MPRKLTPEHRLELDSLNRILQVVGEFLDERISENREGFAAAIRRTYEAKDLRGMRMVRGDLVAMLQAASLEELRELDQRLRTGAGVTIDELCARELVRIARIRARGKVTSEEQYYIVRERVEFIAGHAERAEECTELTGMLHAFEERTAARGKKRDDP